jgi:hypothetical protein
MFEGKFIVASGPVIVEENKLMVNKDEKSPCGETKEIKWLDIDEIKQGKHNVAPNINFLIKKGDIR